MRRQHLPSGAGAHLPMGGGIRIQLSLPMCGPRHGGTEWEEGSWLRSLPEQQNEWGSPRPPGLPLLVIPVGTHGPLSGALALACPPPAHTGTHRQTAMLPNRSPTAGGPSLPDNSGSPRQRLHLLGIMHCQRGLAPDKGGCSAGLGTEPTSQGLLGAGQGVGKVERPGD